MLFKNILLWFSFLSGTADHSYLTNLNEVFSLQEKVIFHVVVMNI